MVVENELDYNRKMRKIKRNEAIRKKNKRNDLIIYSFSLLGIFLLGIFLGVKLFNISTEDYKTYATVENKKAVQYTEKNITNVEKDSRIDKGINSKVKSNMNNDNVSKQKDKNIKSKNECSTNKFKNQKICYLTFDDGPTKNITPEILKVLKEKDVKATFFVLGKMAEVNPELIIREKEEGHLIANHTYCHDYKYLYSSSDNLIKDFKKSHEAIKRIIGEEPVKIVRFPGGSFNKGELQKRVNKEGFHYVDWNCLNGDAEALNVPEEKLINKVKETMGNQEHIVILMHDSGTKQTTARSLGRVIDHIKSKGYAFKTLDEAFVDK